MENKREKNMGRLLYIALAVVLCAGVAVSGILLATGDKTRGEGDMQVGAEVDPSLVLPEFVAPAVGLVTKGHDTETLVYSATTDDWRTHCGIDISCALGDGVMAAADGVITNISEDPMLGLTITIRHTGGAISTYSNLGAELAEGIELGTTVTAGQLLGCVGESATLELSDEPHLHFTLKVNGEYVDPMDFITGDSAAASLGKDIAYEG